MPLTSKGEEIKAALQKEYGAKKGEQVLYAGENKGTFTGIHSADCPIKGYMDACTRGDSAAIGARAAELDKRK